MNPKALHHLGHAGLIGLVCTLVVLVGCGGPSYPTVVFPTPGAVLSNPVRLETQESVTWTIDGQTVGSGRSWRGNLSTGLHTVVALSDVAGTEFSITVRDAFPKNAVRSVRAADLPDRTLTLSEGRYWMVLGNPGAQKRSWDSGQVKTAIATSQNPAMPNHENWSTTSDATSGTILDTTSSLTSGHTALLEQFSSRTKTLLRAGVKPLSTETGFRAQSLEVPDLGTARSFQVLNLSGSGSQSVMSTLHYVGNHVLAYVEDGLEPVTLELIRGIAAGFDSRIYDLDVGVFGPVADVDNNGRVTLLFTPKLNESKQAIGFFYPGDMLQRTQDNPDSNQADILYLGVPAAGNANFSVSSLEATSCHEFQHLIHFSRKTLPHLSDAQPIEEDVSINEGLSHLAEDLCGYNLKGGNLAFVAKFLEHPERVSLDGLSLDGRGDSIERRGAMYLFTRFLYERYGSAFISRLIASPGSGLENIAAVLNQPLDALMWRWWWSLSLKSGVRVGQVQGFNRVTTNAVTGDVLGVNLWAGSLEVIPGFNIDLKGPTALSDWPNALAARGVAFRQVTGPLTIKLPVGAEVGVLRLP